MPPLTLLGFGVLLCAAFDLKWYWFGVFVILWAIDLVASITSYFGDEDDDEQMGAPA